MVYTKHINIHKLKHLRQAKDYMENAEKVSIDKNKIESHLDNIFPYITNADKTMSKQLVSGYQVTDVYNAANEFIATRMAAQLAKGTNVAINPRTGKLNLSAKSLEKNNAVLGHHLIQSFSPDDDLTPEQIHEIGRQTVLELTGGNHAFVIATHTDRAHIHNHIIFNSTNIFTGKQYDWKVLPAQEGKKAKDVTKLKFEAISDKIASKYGAKIIEKSPKNSHLKYTMWQTENLYKNKIKQRLDFLLEHSHSISDFQEKAEALNLHVDFSGKWTTYRLLDEPQVKNTRSRSLDKKHPERYNLDQIEDRLEENDIIFSVEEILERYEEKEAAKHNDFDFQIEIEPWQVSHKTEKGYYLNVDFGVESRGQIFIGAYQVDALENGNYALYIKRNQWFKFLDNQDAARNRGMRGDVLVKQLRLYNGTVPIRKESVIESMNEIVSALNFLAKHDVTYSHQFQNLQEQLEGKLEEAKNKMNEADDKIFKLVEVGRHLLVAESDDSELAQNARQILQDLKVSPELTYQELQQDLIAEKRSRNILKSQLDQTISEFNRYNEIQMNGERTQRKAGPNKS